MVKMNYLSDNIIKIMNELSKDEGLVKLLLNNEDCPIQTDLPNEFVLSGSTNDKKYRKIIKPNDDFCRISPIPFTPEAITDDNSFIRVYYNIGEFDGSEVINELQLNIDIVVAKSLWLIHDKDRNKSQIRPYEIMARIVDRIGKRSGNPLIQVDFNGFQHLSVNTKFDAIRLYSEYFNIKA